MAPQLEDWAAIVDRLVDGDAMALLKVSRLITGYLAHWRAYDFREEWDDLVQEALVGIVRGAQKGQIRDRAATVGYIRQIARNKFADRLKRHLDHREDHEMPWEEELDRTLGSSDGAGRPDTIVEVRQALGRLPERERRAVCAVYVEGKTYEQVAQETGTPLGTLKRDLRMGMARLRRELGARAPA